MTAVLDTLCLAEVRAAPQSVIPWFLCASYLYYIRDISLLSDTLYDKLATVIARSWDLLEHPHKRLLSRSDLASGSLFSLQAGDYPTIVKSSSCRLASSLLGYEVSFKYGVQ